MSARSRAGKKPRLIVGIDYGTTYSGIAFSPSDTDTENLDSIAACTSWPGSDGTSLKVPSCIAFESDNLACDFQGGTSLWGFNVDPGMTSYAWTKLLLDGQALPAEFDDPKLKKMVGGGLSALLNNRDPEEVATEYLRGMHSMFLKEIKRSGIEGYAMDIYLTVPASWSLQARTKTHRAAMAAGFGTGPEDQVYLISEPEAAAQIMLHTKISETHGLVTPGNRIMVCDCGGGTVDLTSYEILKTSPLELNELCVGETGKCGGTFVDRNLYDLLANRFKGAFTSMSPEDIGPGSRFMDEFEVKKRAFSMTAKRNRAIKLPLAMLDIDKDESDKNKWYDFQTNQVLLTHADMQEIHDPVVDMIIHLVSKQVDDVKQKCGSSIQMMIVVGGFSLCPYLCDKLDDWCTVQGIRLLQPIDRSSGWSAVVRGAVLRGIVGAATREFKCRKHYGISLSKAYDPDKHGHIDKNNKLTRRWIHEVNGTEQQDGLMHWKIPKHRTIDKCTEIPHSFTQLFIATKDKKDWNTAYLKLYACSLDKAPPTRAEEGIETIGELKFSLDKIDWQDTTISKREYSTYVAYELHLTCYMRLADESGFLKFRIEYQDEVAGAVELKIE